MKVGYEIPFTRYFYKPQPLRTLEEIRDDILALIEKELKALRERDRLTPDLVFRDPYVLDFLGLKDTYIGTQWSVYPCALLSLAFARTYAHCPVSGHISQCGFDRRQICCPCFFSSR